jgi:peptidoglycan hydrolase-like protein with peptidoglycan-binding domain
MQANKIIKLKSMIYPNRVIKKGEADKAIVKAIQKKLNEYNCGPVNVDGDFGDKTTSAVKLFQTRHTDIAGNSLVADGQIGSISWAALFGDRQVQNDTSVPEPLLAGALLSAISQINVVEQPRGSNRGPEVDVYLRSVGLKPETGHFSWCAAFVYWSYQQAANKLKIVNPLIKTPGVLDHWNRAKCTKISKVTAVNEPFKVKPGSIFIIDHGGGLGHTGIVESVNGGNLVTIEGNTNSGSSREGYGVFRLTRRKLTAINKGFLKYDM